MEIAFEIVAVNGDGLDWSFSENEIGLQGRACRDMSVGDVLVAQSGGKFEVLKIHSYKREWESISAGMSCALVVRIVDKEAIFYHEAQKLAERLLYTAS